MDNSIIVAIITGIFSVLAVAFTNARANADMDAKLDKKQAVTDEKIFELTRSVEKHNSVIERVYKLEQTSAVMENRIKVSEHRIEDLEKRI